MSYCGECYYQGKKLKPCSTCYCGSEAKTELTNADRIRAMNDEELAEFFSSLDHACLDGECFICFGVNYISDDERSILDWLQSEAE